MADFHHLRADDLQADMQLPSHMMLPTDAGARALLWIHVLATQACNGVHCSFGAYASCSEWLHSTRQMCRPAELQPGLAVPARPAAVLHQPELSTPGSAA